MFPGMTVIDEGYGEAAAALAPYTPSVPELLLGFGGIAVAMVVNYYQLSSGTMTDVVVTTVLVAVILNELVSPYLARVVLGKAGEIPRWPA